MEIAVDQKKFSLETMTTPSRTHNDSGDGRRRHYDRSDDDVCRPNKRQGNRFTMTRIAAYPRIKVPFSHLFLCFPP